MCERERVRESCERAFMTHMRESILCYTFDAFNHDAVVCVCVRVRDSCERAHCT